MAYRAPGLAGSGSARVIAKSCPLLRPPRCSAAAGQPPPLPSAPAGGPPACCVDFQNVQLCEGFEHRSGSVLLHVAGMHLKKVVRPRPVWQLVKLPQVLQHI